jgi:ABC-type antimicrobial peptide transport system permease subunit
MIKNYFLTAWRNLIKGKGYSLINIGGLSVGMAVAILIGLWIYDEVQYDKYHQNYDRIAQVMQHQTYNGEIGTQTANPAVMAGEIRRLYGNDFKHVLQSSWNFDHAFTYGDKILLIPGSFFEPGVADMLTLKMKLGSRNGLADMNSILLCQSSAKALFGNENPLGKILKVDNQYNVKVTGVYEDLPDNTSFKDLKMIMPWSLYLSQNPWVEKMKNPWGSNFTQTYVQIGDNANMQKVSAKLRDLKLNQQSKGERRYKPIVFLHPMSKWHLYSDFKGGINTGGRISNVWLFGIIGIFVLLLACINFMNLSTARSEKRSKEVGIRKAVGSVRKQLIVQFLTESVLLAAFAFVVSMIFVIVALPYFNDIADKKMHVLWGSPLFWLLALGFTLLTGLIAGLYPALFLSSFQPVKVLKGTYRVGKFAALPRQVLVVLQFAISIALIIGTIVVYQQIKLGQNRPIGYSRDGLVTHSVTDVMHKHFESLRADLKNSGAIVEMTESGSPTTDVWNTNGGFDWEGKDPNQAVDFPNNAVTWEYGKTIGWKIKEGRDFSREFATDSLAFILNESAVSFIGLKNPIGKTISWEKKPYKVIGVVEDILTQSPYKPVRPSMFHIDTSSQNVFIMKVNPSWSMHNAMSKIESTFKKFDPASPFKASFADEEFAKKFGDEKRTGTIAAFFAALAIFISCLGLFGLASFVAEQRVKEIGIRKVLGASVSNIWQLLSKEFVILVVISSVVGILLAYIYMTKWLSKYDFHTSVTWQVCLIAAFGALAITALTVSFQAIKAAIANPVKSLRAE